MKRLALALAATAALTIGSLPADADGSLSKSAAKKAVAAQASKVALELGDARDFGARRCKRKSPNRVRCVGYLRFNDGSHCKWRQTARRSGSRIMVGEWLQVRCFEGSGAGGVDGESESESELDPALDVTLPEVPPPDVAPPDAPIP